MDKSKKEEKRLAGIRFENDTNTDARCVAIVTTSC